MKTMTLLLIGFATALSAQTDFSNANVNPDLLYGKALDAYNKGGPINFNEAKDFYRDGGYQAVKPASPDAGEAARKAASANEKALADLRYLLNRTPPTNGARIPEMPRLKASPFQSANPGRSRSKSGGDIVQSGNPLDMLVVQDQALSPAFRSPGVPAMKSPEVSKNYNFFSGSTTTPDGGGSSRSGSAFGLGSSRPSSAGSGLTGGSYSTPGAGAALRSSASVISSERASAFGAGAAKADAAKGAAKK